MFPLNILQWQLVKANWQYFMKAFLKLPAFLPLYRITVKGVLYRLSKKLVTCSHVSSIIVLTFADDACF